MNPAVIISPHLDDAVLSLGRFMAGRPNTIVVTVCAGIPGLDGPSVDNTTFDRSSGFVSSIEAMLARRDEDLSALSLLRAEASWLPCLDGQYDDSPTHLAAFSAFLDDPLPDGCDTVLVPLGIKHPDHEDVAEIILRSEVVDRWRDDGVGVWVYEELPGRVLWPIGVEDSLGRWMFMLNRELTLGFVGTGSLALKRRALNQYKSQRVPLEIVDGWDVAIVCPERVWRVE